MTTFTKGPAEGINLLLHRSPLFIRVTVDQGGEMDALDDPGDQIKPGDVPYTYRRLTKGGTVFASSRGHTRTAFSIATYALHEIQPDRGVMTDNARWQEWCRAQAELISGGSK